MNKMINVFYLLSIALTATNAFPSLNSSKSAHNYITEPWTDSYDPTPKLHEIKVDDLVDQLKQEINVADNERKKEISDTLEILHQSITDENQHEVPIWMHNVKYLVNLNSVNRRETSENIKNLWDMIGDLIKSFLNGFFGLFGYKPFEEETNENKNKTDKNQDDKNDKKTFENQTMTDDKPKPNETQLRDDKQSNASAIKGKKAIEAPKHVEKTKKEYEHIEEEEGTKLLQELHALEEEAKKNPLSSQDASTNGSTPAEHAKPNDPQQKEGKLSSIQGSSDTQNKHDSNPDNHDADSKHQSSHSEDKIKESKNAQQPSDQLTHTSGTNPINEGKLSSVQGFSDTQTKHTSNQDNHDTGSKQQSSELKHEVEPIADEIAKADTSATKASNHQNQDETHGETHKATSPQVSSLVNRLVADSKNKRTDNHGQNASQVSQQNSAQPNVQGSTVNSSQAITSISDEELKAQTENFISRYATAGQDRNAREAILEELKTFYKTANPTEQQIIKMFQLNSNLKSQYPSIQDNDAAILAGVIASPLQQSIPRNGKLV